MVRFWPLPIFTLFAIWLRSAFPAFKSGLALWLALADRIWWKWGWASSGPRPQKAWVPLIPFLFMRTSLVSLLEDERPHGTEPRQPSCLTWGPRHLREHSSNQQSHWAGPQLTADTWASPTQASSDEQNCPASPQTHKQKYVLLEAAEGLWLFVMQHCCGNW